MSHHTSKESTDATKNHETRRIAGTAILASLVIVFDYSLKFSGLKIPFPWTTFLRFDFTGVPIALALLLYGLSSSATTCLVACIAIVARSGDVVGGGMKMLAEFSTVLGIALGLRLSERFAKSSSVILGVLTRVVVLTPSNMLLLPAYYGMSQTVTIGLLPLIAVFNALQGTVTVLGGYMLYELYTRRVSVRSSQASYTNTSSSRGRTKSLDVELSDLT